MLKTSIKKWFFLAFLLIASLVFALKTSIEVSYFIFWIISSLVVISLVYLLITYFMLNLYIDRRVAAKVEEDDFIEIEALIKNNARLPVVSLLLQDFLPCAEEADKRKSILIDYLRAKSLFNLRYRLLCPLRGRYMLGPFFIYIFDPLGIFFFKKTYYIYSELYVYPRTFNIKKLPPLTKGIVPWFGIQTGRASGDDHDFFGVREYKPEDPIKRIHWFSTAQKSKLIVKQFQQHFFYRATIMFNLKKENNFGSGKESVAEYTIKIAASLSKCLLSQNTSLEIIAHAGEIVHIPFNKGAGHLEDIFKFLAMAQAESRLNLNEIFQEYFSFIPDDSTLLIIMPDRELKYLPSMAHLRNRNIQIIPLILLSDTFLAGGIYKDELEEIHLRIIHLFGTFPIFFSRGVNPEQAFLK